MTLAIGKGSSIRLWHQEEGELWKAQPRNEKIKWIKVLRMETEQKPINWYITTYEKMGNQVIKGTKINDFEDIFDNLSLSTTY